jgi:hypothetical protein
MARLTDKVKEYIKQHPDTSHRKLAEMIDLEFQIKVSHTAVANFRKKLAVKDVKFTKFTPKTPSKNTTKSKKFDFPLSIDKLNSLLQTNKDHYWYEYLNKQLNGRLRSDFQKLLEFIRDTVTQ